MIRKIPVNTLDLMMKASKNKQQRDAELRQAINMLNLAPVQLGHKRIITTETK